jgi:hypothetical protein
MGAFVTYISAWSVGIGPSQNTVKLDQFFFIIFPFRFWLGDYKVLWFITRSIFHVSASIDQDSNAFFAPPALYDCLLRQVIIIDAIHDRDHNAYHHKIRNAPNTHKPEFIITLDKTVNQKAKRYHLGRQHQNMQRHLAFVRLLVFSASQHNRNTDKRNQKNNRVNQHKYRLNAISHNKDVRDPHLFSRNDSHKLFGELISPMSIWLDPAPARIWYRLINDNHSIHPYIDEFVILRWVIIWQFHILHQHAYQPIFPAEGPMGYVVAAVGEKMQNPKCD